MGKKRAEEMHNIEKIKNYTVLTMLHPGNARCVYLVKNDLEERFVAKLVKISNSNNLVFKEVDVLQKVNHENIIKMIDSFVFQNDDNIYLVIIMEYMPGGVLSSRIGGTENEAKMKRYMIEIAKGVAHLHEKHIIHRNLKPENIFFGHKGLILGGFGVSKILKNHTDVTYTQTGTLQYMDGNVISRRQYGKEVDIWSLGIIFIELLTGFRIEKLIPKGAVPSKMSDFYNNDIRKKIRNKKYVDLIEGMLKKDSSRLSIFQVLQVLGVEMNYSHEINTSTQTSYQKCVYKNGYYQGEMIGKMREGKGKMRYISGEQYQGYWKNDLFHFKGVFRDANMDSYDGGWEFGKKNGNGICKFENGSKYEGQWQDDQFNGKGKFTEANGDFYDGDFRRNLRHGYGILWTKNRTFAVQYNQGLQIQTQQITESGKSYQKSLFYRASKNNIHQKTIKRMEQNRDNEYMEIELNNSKEEEHLQNGYFENLSINDVKIVNYPNGDNYEGELKDNLKEGEGVYTFRNGDRYDGQWKNDLMDGYGKFQYADGSLYQGDMKEGKQNGRGAFYWRNNDVYHGQFQDNNMHGKGIIILNGNKFKVSYQMGHQIEINPF